MNTSLSQLTSQQLRRAADITEQIEALQNELAGILGEAGEQTGRRKRKFSAVGIARIRAGQKARWARIKAATGGQDRKPKRK